jgi:hypothetical protein
MEKFYSFLQHVLKMPGMFKVSKIEDIEFIILGYSVALDHHLSANEVDSFFIDFNQHVCKKYRLDASYGWCKVLRFFSGSDGHSLKLFEENLNEWHDKMKKHNK